MKKPSATRILLVLLVQGITSLQVGALPSSKQRQLQRRSLRAWLAELFSFLFGNNTSDCFASAGCGNGSYCSSSGVCQENGSCESLRDCFNPDNEFMTIQCVGSMECNQQRCGIVCDGPDSIFESCSSSSDCDVGEYCADGRCRDNGTCGKDLDCLNPNNLYIRPFCIGVISCGAGMCGIDCGSPCPGKIQPARCESLPCDSPPSCQEDWEVCINDFCSGGCDTRLLDAAGREVRCTAV